MGAPPLTFPRSVWRPLVERVTDCPLAVCDSRTISDDDLVECDLVYKDYEGEFYVLHHAEAHRWFYLSGQTRDEVILLLNLDSHRDIREYPYLSMSFQSVVVIFGGRMCAHGFLL